MAADAEFVISLGTAVALLTLIFVVGVIILCICVVGAVLTCVLCKSTCKDVKSLY